MKLHLIPLAVTLNTARIEANAHSETEWQLGLYGDCSRALQVCLTLIFEGDTAVAEYAYQSILDGNVVYAAIAQAKEQFNV